MPVIASPDSVRALLLYCLKHTENIKHADRPDDGGPYAPLHSFYRLPHWTATRPDGRPWTVPTRWRTEGKWLCHIALSYSPWGEEAIQSVLNRHGVSVAGTFGRGLCPGNWSDWIDQCPGVVVRAGFCPGDYNRNKYSRRETFLRAVLKTGEF